MKAQTLLEFLQHFNQLELKEMDVIVISDDKIRTFDVTKLNVVCKEGKHNCFNETKLNYNLNIIVE